MGLINTAHSYLPSVVVLPSVRVLPLVGVFVAFAIGLWIITTLYSVFTSPLRRIPGPTSTLLSNLPRKLSVINLNSIYWIESLHQKYGPIVRLSPTEVSVNSVEGFKQIHSPRAAFVKSKWYDKVTALPRLSLFSLSDKRVHGPRRKLLGPPFSKTALRRQWESEVRPKCELAVKRMGEESQMVGKVDVLKWFTFMTSDVVGELSFGESFGNLERGEKNQFITVMEKMLIGNVFRSELPFVAAIMRQLPVPSIQELFNGNIMNLGYGIKAVESARSHGAGGTRNIFSTAFAMAEEGADTLDDLDIGVEASNLIFAGTDTTSITSTYLIWSILSHPKLQEGLEEEVAQLPADFSDADLEALPLLNAAVEENLRLYGAVPGAQPRDTPPGGAHFGEYFVPEGYVVSTSSFSLHRDPKLFSNPEQFNPYRWLDTSNPLPKEARSVFSPFGAGARTCIGAHLARMEMRFAAAFFFREYRGIARLAPETTPESMKPEGFFIVAPSGHKCEVVIGKA